MTAKNWNFTPYSGTFKPQKINIKFIAISSYFVYYISIIMNS